MYYENTNWKNETKTDTARYLIHIVNAYHASFISYNMHFVSYTNDCVFLKNKW